MAPFSRAFHPRPHRTRAGGNATPAGDAQAGSRHQYSARHRTPARVRAARIGASLAVTAALAVGLLSIVPELNGSASAAGPTATPLPVPSATGDVGVKPVIGGTVRLDGDGDGELTSEEADPGVGGQTVRLYSKQGRLLAAQTTDSEGRYSFTAPSAGHTTYYVRLVQPRVDGVNAAQMWASADATAQNPVMARCVGAGGKPAQMGRSGPCRGARDDGVDPTDVGSDVATEALIVTTVQITAAHGQSSDVSWGITTTRSWGDAPGAYRTTAAQGGPHEISDPSASAVWLGKMAGQEADGTPSAVADAHTTDDGVEVTAGQVAWPLQGAVLAPGSTVTFDVAVSGPEASGAVVDGWIEALTQPGRPAGSFPEAATVSGVASSDGVAHLVWQVPGTVPAGGAQAVFARFRVARPAAAAAAGLGPDDPAGSVPGIGSDAANSVPWVVTGEVEDYRLVIANGTPGPAPTPTGTPTVTPTGTPSSSAPAPTGGATAGVPAVTPGAETTSAAPVPVAAASTLTVSARADGGTVRAGGPGYWRARVRVVGAGGDPVAGVTASFTVRAPDGTSQVLTPLRSSDQAGNVIVDFAAAKPGTYRVSATIRVRGRAVPVGGSPREVVFSAAR